MKAFENLKISEIKKAERFAAKRDGKPVRMTGWYWDGKVDDLGFVRIECEMCSNDMSDREDDVILWIPLFDRRMSRAAAI